MDSPQHHLRLNVVCRQEEGAWVARCPELRLVAADADLDKAWDQIVRVCTAHLRHGLSAGHDLRSLIHPPPTDMLAILTQAMIDKWLRVEIKGQVQREATIYRVMAQAA